MAWLSGLNPPDDRPTTSGAVLFRGFTTATATPPDFEAVTLALEPALETVYLGTSPRRLVGIQIETRQCSLLPLNVSPYYLMTHCASVALHRPRHIMSHERQYPTSSNVPRLPQVEGCKYVHTASEFPGWRIVPAHMEMSFRRDPPRKIFFFAESPNTSPGGETPLVDFRQVSDGNSSRLPTADSIPGQCALRNEI